MQLGIEQIGFYGGRAFIDVMELAELRGLDPLRFANLLIRKKTVHFPWEDPVTFAVNAAQPLLARLTEPEKKRITHLIIASESGIDFGKSLATWIHPHLGLPKQMRLLEIKQACYAGTAALQTALGMLSRMNTPDDKALVICTDIARPIPFSYAEPTQGGAAIAMLVGQPDLLEVEAGASGFYGHHAMDAFRPDADQETGDADLSVLTYIQCLQRSYEAYQSITGGSDFLHHFDLLAFHTPFGGMVKGAHRSLLRHLYQMDGASIEADFHRRLAPSLRYCSEVGNIYSGTVFLALVGALASSQRRDSGRIGLFSYGSGCSSEFYSGRVGSKVLERLAEADLGGQLNSRLKLSMKDYERVIGLARASHFGVRHLQLDLGALEDLYASAFQYRRTLVLRSIKDYERHYEWS